MTLFCQTGNTITIDPEHAATVRSRIAEYSADDADIEALLNDELGIL